MAPLCLLASILTGCAGSSSSNNGGGGGGGTTTTPAAPTVVSVSPTTVTAGAGATTLTITGTNFTTSTTIQVGTVIEQTAYVSATQVTAIVPASQLTSGAALNIIAANGTQSSASGTAVTFTVNNPSPTITALNPATLASGSGDTTVNVTGTGFTQDTKVQVNGTARTTTYVSSTQVNVVVTAADLSANGSLNIIAVNPTPGGGSSSASTIAVNNPVPGSLVLSPSAIVVGTTTPTTVTVKGTGFIPASVVQVNGVARASTYVSSTQLTFQVSASEQLAIRSYSISVTNPAPGGGTSSSATLSIVTPTQTPVISTITPTQFSVGSSGGVAVFGTNLTFNCTILWNSTTLSTTVVTSSINGIYLSGAVPTSLLTSAGTASITANCPSATPSASNALTVNIVNPPPPTLTGISPSTGPINTASTISINGSGFTFASTVNLNGTNLSATYQSPNLMTATIPASSINLPGAYNITVTTPAPGGGTTAPLAYAAYVGIPNNSMVYNPANGLFYLSVSGAAGPPYGNSVVSIDPLTGALGTPIYVGSEPNKIAISSDGHYLWVGLDGASAVRQVDLTTGIAGLQFNLNGNSGIYNNPITATALAALPGSPSSVIVATTSNLSNKSGLSIFDNGVIRPNSALTSNGNGVFYSILVDGTKQEIYAGGSSYMTYTYDSTGLILKASVNNSSSSNGSTFATQTFDEMQIANGKLYTDYGKSYDAETGALLGTFYASGTNAAVGPVIADANLGKAFVLDNSNNVYYGGTYNQIQVFNLSDLTLSGTAVIPVSAAAGTNTYYYSYGAAATNPGPNRLTRWGTNGLAFRTNLGFYSLRSNLVKDVSTVSTDLGVTLSSTGTPTTGSNLTYTASILNQGPATATNVSLLATVPSTGVLISATPSVGACSITGTPTCDLGSLASGSSATVTFVAQVTTSGNATLTAKVSGSEADSKMDNNSATQTVTVTGNTYNLVPTLATLAPAAIASGSGDTTITITGANFSTGATAYLGTSALTTSVASATQLTATVPAAQLASLGWGQISVQNPMPGGGASNAVPLTVYTALNVGANHILYDPYSRKIMGSIGSASTAVTGNSIVAITPESASIGTPVNIGSQPTYMALTSDGNILYTILAGNQNVARFNMLTQQPDFSYQVPPQSTFSDLSLRGVAVQPGTENTVALDLAAFTGIGLYDFDTAKKTAAPRGQATGPYTGSCIQFLDANNLLSFDTDTTGATLNRYPVTATGLPTFNSTQGSKSTLYGFGCFKVSGGTAYGVNGGVADPSTSPATQLGIFLGANNTNTFNSGTGFVPDKSLQKVFYPQTISGNTTSYGPNLIKVFDTNHYQPVSQLPLNINASEGNANYTIVDMIRWGQDGLAILTNSGHLYLLRGGSIASQLLNTNTAAVLTSSSSSTIAHGTGNTILTFTGSNFVPGVAVTWNGSYRTTTIVDATHVTVAIPASDLASTGTASVVATNPGAPNSSALTITIN